MTHTFVGTYRHHDRSGATIVRLSVATDFAARTDEAQAAADRIAMAAHGSGAVATSHVLAATHPDGGTVASAIGALARHLGEPVGLLGVARMDKDGAVVSGFVRHPME